MAISTGVPGGREAGCAPTAGARLPRARGPLLVRPPGGTVAVVVVGGLRGRFDGDMLNLAGMGAGLGMFLGLFIGLCGVSGGPASRSPRDPEPTTPVRPEAGPAPSPQLWDPWWTAAATSTGPGRTSSPRSRQCGGGARGPDPRARRGPAPGDLAGDRRGDPAGR